MQGDEKNLGTAFELIDFSLVLGIVLVVLLLWAAGLAVRRVFAGLESWLPGHRLTILQAETLASFFIWLGGGTFLVLAVIRPPKELILALTGTLAVAVGFAFKDVAASIIAGIILIFDRPFRVGDRVRFGEHYGDVTRIGLRSVRLQTLEDDTVTVPNHKFLTESVASGNAGALHMMVTTEFHLDPLADLATACELLREVAVTCRYVFLKNPVMITATEEMIANRLAMKLTVKCYVLDARYQESLSTDLTIRGAEALAEAGIGRPRF